MKSHRAALARLPDMESRGSAMWLHCQGARSSSIDSSGLVFAYRGLGSLLHHLRSMYDVSGASDSYNSASPRSNDLVGPPGVTDACRVRFQSSSSTGWISQLDWASVVMGGWLGRPMYVRLDVARVVPVLTVLPS